MGDAPDTRREGSAPRLEGGAVSVRDLRAWFLREVLPLEAALTRFLRRNWRNESEVDDLLQEVYVRVFEGAQKQIPESAKPFVFATAHNLLVDRVRHSKVVPIEAVAELDALDVVADEPGPDRNAIARDELRRLQLALDRLPPRAREAIVLKQVEGLPRREVAARMKITERTVQWHLSEGLQTLAAILYGDPTLGERK
jgi:RNA polymerase sigma factor (sigma-70 family)